MTSTSNDVYLDDCSPRLVFESGFDDQRRPITLATFFDGEGHIVVWDAPAGTPIDAVVRDWAAEGVRIIDQRRNGA